MGHLAELEDSPVTIRDANPEDIEAIAPLLRLVDKKECKALLNLEPLEGLMGSYGHSEFCYVAEDEEAPVALFGVGNRMVWMVATPRLPKYSKTLHRLAKGFLSEWREAAGESLWALAWDGNGLHHKWLDRSGFKLRGYTEWTTGEVFRVYEWDE